MTLSAGVLNKYCRVEILTGTKLPSGQIDPDDFTLVRKRWANIRGQSGLASIRNEELNAQVEKVSIRVRHMPDANNRMRLMHIKSGTYYYVTHVKHDEERDEYTDLICQKTNPHA